jgi:Amino acid permease
VPHYLGAFRPSLTHQPGDVIGGLIVIGLLAWLNIRGIGESANLNLILAVLDLATQVLIICIGAVLVLNPSLLVHQVELGSTPTYSNLIFALSLAMLAYTGIETLPSGDRDFAGRRAVRLRTGIRRRGRCGCSAGPRGARSCGAGSRCGPGAPGCRRRSPAPIRR